MRMYQPAPVKRRTVEVLFKLHKSSKIWEHLYLAAASLRFEYYNGLNEASGGVLRYNSLIKGE